MPLARQCTAAIAAIIGLTSAAFGAAPVEVRVTGLERVGAVRLMIYADEATFLKAPMAKLEAPIDENGVAVFRISHLEPGEYAFAAYHDANGDGVLNRNRLGLPKEAYAFSNNVVPRLRRPSFNRTKVTIDGPSAIGFALGRAEGGQND